MSRACLQQLKKTFVQGVRRYHNTWSSKTTKDFQINKSRSAIVLAIACKNS